jgi:hypothetical protein
MLPQNKNKNAEKVQSYIKEEKVPLGTYLKNLLRGGLNWTIWGEAIKKGAFPWRAFFPYPPCSLISAHIACLKHPHEYLKKKLNMKKLPDFIKHEHSIIKSHVF